MVKITSFSDLLKGLLAVILALFGVFGLAKVGVVPMLVPTKFVDIAYQIINIGFAILIYLFLVGCVVVAVMMIVSYFRNRNKAKEKSQELVILEALLQKTEQHINQAEEFKQEIMRWKPK